MDPATLFAVFRRLTGYPLDAQGNPLLNADGTPRNIEGSYGLRLPALRRGDDDQNLSRLNPDGLRLWDRGYHPNQFVQVPVWLEGVEAKKWEDVWPCCSFGISDIQVGGNPYSYDTTDGADGIWPAGTVGPTGDQGSETITNPATGYTYAHPTSRTVRPNPEPWDVLVTVSLYSRSPVEMAFLERAFLNLFRQKGALLVEQLDGTSRPYDMVFERYSTMDQGEPYDPQQGTGGEHAAYLHRAFTYRVETFLDNSASRFGTNEFRTAGIIRERILELAALQTTLVETRSLEAFTPPP